MSTKLPIALRLPSEAVFTMETKTVDLTPKITSATVLRDGATVVTPKLNASKVTALVDQLAVARRITIPRVVSQTVPTGTRVVLGTVIDVVLVPAADIGFNLLDDLHADFTPLTIDKVLPLFDDPEVTAIVNKAADPTTVTPSEKEVLSAKLKPLGISIDDNNAQKSTAAALSTLQQARAFK